MDRRFRVYITLTLMILMIAVISSVVVRVSEKEMIEAYHNQTASASQQDVNDRADSENASAYYFRTQELLEQHYEKHGRDMGFASAEEYERAAAAVITDPRALHKIEKEDGDDVYYIEETNEFVVVSTDGFIRTYFLPDSGKEYYYRQ
ncbi:MAG: hypothetical protein IKI46_03760 [Lachnospiraceae bacterium]|nr:hypothetical protein [Lachnospiraceae bacterium]